MEATPSLRVVRTTSSVGRAEASAPHVRADSEVLVAVKTKQRGRGASRVPLGTNVTVPM